MTVRAIALTAALALASVAQAETRATPEEQALLARPDFQAWLKEVGVGARIIGECDRFGVPGADGYVASLAALDFDGRPGASEFEGGVHQLLLKSYDAGRKAAAMSDLDAAACGRLVREHLALRAAAERAAGDFTVQLGRAPAHKPATVR